MVIRKTALAEAGIQGVLARDAESSYLELDGLAQL